MHGLPGATQLYAGQWQHDALQAADERRRAQSDSDFERQLVHQHARAIQLRLIAAGAAIAGALAVIAMV